MMYPCFNIATAKWTEFVSAAKGNAAYGTQQSRSMGNGGATVHMGHTGEKLQSPD